MKRGNRKVEIADANYGAEDRRYNVLDKVKEKFNVPGQPPG